MGSVNWMLAGMLVSTIGGGFFLYGKRQAQPAQLIAGIALMIIPGFVEGAVMLLALGAGILVALWLALRASA